MQTKQTKQTKLETFITWITPWFEAEFEEPLKGLIRETRGFFRGDELFAARVKAGDLRGAKRELRQLLGVVG